MFYSLLLCFYTRTKIQRKQEELRNHQEKIKKEKEERQRIQIQKEQLYRKKSYGTNETCIMSIY
ncbi:hypothetical protein BK737_04980 [Bacillus thuringiensis serovar palmanyolensis]|nr:hypothetical protein BK737_04980 [Bacillus thuringiensis serovar palmanyolensis]